MVLPHFTVFYSISAQFPVVLINQALRNNFDLCLSDAVAISD